ncbi:MAG: lipopolysaccharide assembly protein LapA domain-containing protein [Solirubrobacterales bacterium]
MPEEKQRNNGRLWLLGIAALVALVFILLNSQEVKIKFVVGTTTAPLIFALAISTVLGLVVGYLIGRFRNHD